MRRRVVPAVVMLVVSIALVTAATARTSRDAEARKGGILRLASFQEVDSVDTALAYTPWSLPVVYATCAKLFNLPDAPGAAGTKVVPEVVRAYAVSRDGRTYTFELERTFRFSTG